MPLLMAAIDWHTFFFFLFALVACAFAVAVVVTSNIVRMAFYLTICLGATAGLFFLAGAEFVGAMQLMIYVGGTLVLLIFGVMLTAQERFINMRATAADWVIAAGVGGSLLALLLYAAFSVPDWTTARVDRDSVPALEAHAATPLGLGFMGVYDDGPGYLLPFEIVSVHLLVVLIGAAYLARPKRRGPAVAPRRPAVSPTAHADRRRSPWMSLVLGKGFVVNLVLGILCFAFAADIHEFLRKQNADPPEWLAPAIGALFVVSALLFVVLWGWQRWAFFALLTVGLVQTATVASIGPPAWITAVVFIVTIAPIVAVLFLTTRGGERSLWSQME